MTTVNPGKAQQVWVDPNESFNDYSQRVFLKRFPIKFRDETIEEPIETEEGTVTKTRIKPGEPIVLKLDSVYSAVFLRMKRVLTPQEFQTVFGAIMMTIKQFEAQGLLPEDLVEDVMTPFDLSPPIIPERFLEELEENEEIQAEIVGNVGYELKKYKKPVVIEEPEVEPVPEIEPEPETEPEPDDNE